ncbi:hypothetical protein LIER_42062 [Lithospermum erythrorhizon]|uniref:Uncharacterized protein n=1 Tax=Lithospermum erythrorhizon TaxID=34254 RepID=A0AAV3RKI9_LITER
MLTTAPTTTTTEKFACHAEGSDVKLARSVILGRLDLNEIFENRKRCKFVLQLEANEIELLGRIADVDLPQVTRYMYREMEERRHAKKEAKMQAREEAKRKRKLEKRAARGAA